MCVRMRFFCRLSRCKRKSLSTVQGPLVLSLRRVFQHVLRFFIFRSELGAREQLCPDTKIAGLDLFNLFTLFNAFVTFRGERKFSVGCVGLFFVSKSGVEIVRREFRSRTFEQKKNENEVQDK